MNPMSGRRESHISSSTSQRRFILATVIDAGGGGIWVPFALVFLVQARDLSLTDAGAALTAGSLIGMALGPTTGWLSDKYGAKPVLISSNMVRFFGLISYPLVNSPLQVVIVASIVSFGDRLFWSSNSPMVRAISSGRDTDRIMGVQNMARFAGTGLGAGLTALLPILPASELYSTFAYVNAGSFAISAVLLVTVESSPATSTLTDEEQSNSTWRYLLSHHAYVKFCAVHLLYGLASMSKFFLLPVLITSVLHFPSWVSGLTIAVGTVSMVVIQQPVIRVARRFTRLTALIASSCIFSTAFLLLAWLTIVPLSVAVPLLVVYALLVAVAEAIFAPITIAVAALAAPAGVQGRASALFQLSWGLSGAVAPLALTWLLDVGNTVLWLTVAFLVGLAGPLVFWLRKSLPPNVLT